MVSTAMVSIVMVSMAIASGTLTPESARMDLRSLAYHREFWKAASAAATPWTAVPTREVLMKVNMWLRPRFSVPMSHPLAPSNSIWHVGLPWQPIFSSMRDTLTWLSSAESPSASMSRFGTRKSEMPLVPSGAPRFNSCADMHVHVHADVHVHVHVHAYAYVWVTRCPSLGALVRAMVRLIRAGVKG